MFSELYEIKYHEIYLDGILKPAVLLEFLEDIAAKNADDLHFGYNEITQSNYGWFLLKYAMDFYLYPQNLKKIQIKTEPRGANKLFAYRDFHVYDENDNCLAKIASTWGLVDLKTKAMINPLEVFRNKMFPFEKKEDDLKYNKIPLITNISSEKKFEIRYNDIDVNEHVNNATYLLWAFETLPIKFIKNKKLSRLDINYKKEIKYGGMVKSIVQINANNSIHNLKNDLNNEDLCIISAEWK